MLLSLSLSPFLSLVLVLVVVLSDKLRLTNRPLSTRHYPSAAYHGMGGERPNHGTRLSDARPEQPRAGLDYFLSLADMEIQAFARDQRAGKETARTRHFALLAVCAAWPNSSLSARDCSANDALETMVREPKSSRSPACKLARILLWNFFNAYNGHCFLFKTYGMKVRKKFGKLLLRSSENSFFFCEV